MDRIIIIGGGGHAKVLISVLKKIGRYEIIGYTDCSDKGIILDTKYLGEDNILNKIINDNPQVVAAIGIGNVEISEKRKKIKERLTEAGFFLPAIISPDAIINDDVQIDDGTVVFDGAVVNSGSRIGMCSIINTNCTIEHDCTIGDFVHLAPGATLSGGVKIDDFCVIGTGANIIQYRKIVKNCMIGAGSAVIKDCLISGTYVGIPAKKVQ
jgi:sugar O-acyltransferase (sialic acid O-acetyltransferase NeuD family)